MNARILLVDDEPNLLAGLQRHLRREFDVSTVSGGPQALELLGGAEEAFEVIVSDYRMPVMDGIQFLAHARQLAPDSVRVLFTGQADLRAAISAVNEGNIFRFLMKPCPQEVLQAALHDSVKQHRLATAEKALLEQTLRGAVAVMSEILEAVSPQAFSRSSRLRALGLAMADALQLENRWEVEVAAMLSQIGCVAVPGKVLERKLSGLPLAEPEERLLRGHPALGARLLRSIPRMEAIAEAIALQDAPFAPLAARAAGARQGDALPLLARVLKAVLDYDELTAAGRSPHGALEVMSAQSSLYDPDVLAKLREVTTAAPSQGEMRECPTTELEAGMVLAEDVRDRNGVMLISSGHRLTEVLVLRLRSFASMGTVSETVRILDRAKV